MTEFERRLLLLRPNQKALDINVSLDEGGGGFCFEQVCFNACIDVDEENNFGFYDWLRDASGDVVGVRIAFLSAVPDWLRRLNIVDSSIDETSLIVQLFFEGFQGVDESASEDQLLGDIRLLKGGDGSVILGVNREVTRRSFPKANTGQ